MPHHACAIGDKHPGRCSAHSRSHEGETHAPSRRCSSRRRDSCAHAQPTLSWNLSHKTFENCHGHSVRRESTSFGSPAASAMARCLRQSRANRSRAQRRGRHCRSTRTQLRRFITRVCWCRSRLPICAVRSRVILSAGAHRMAVLRKYHGPRRSRNSSNSRIGEQGRDVQTDFTFRTWGGRRKGAGRRKRSDETVPHIVRPSHSLHRPLHITVRMVKSAPDLRQDRVIAAIRSVFQRVRQRKGFRLTNYSVQRDHMHLIAEATDRVALSNAMRSVCSSLARAVNRTVGRRGQLVAERYHARALRVPKEVRRVLLYVLRNSHHHERAQGNYLPPWHYDPCSSALEFDGFAVHPEFPPPPLIERCTTVAPQYSYLLAMGWKRHGLIAITEVPS